jgi:hypothetical protein
MIPMISNSELSQLYICCSELSYLAVKSKA